MSLSSAQKCLDFIDESVSCFHAVSNMEKELLKNGFNALDEKQDWKLEKGKSYYVKRNDSSILAFRIPKEEIKGFHIVASHSDSPSFKVKANAGITVENSYVKLNVEPYGGMIHATWLDRCLSVAGRVVYQEGSKLISKPVNIDEDLLVIPNLAIHMNREMNKNLSYNPQIDLQPLICADGDNIKGEGKESNVLEEKLSFYAKVPAEEILGRDLFLYVREKGKLAGANKELMISPRQDDLSCVFASLEGLLSAKQGNYIAVSVVFDNEEVGSLTRQGAASTFLKDTMERIAQALQLTGSAYLRLLADSFMISADNAHAMHPNHPEKADPTNRPCLNKGEIYHRCLFGSCDEEYL